MNARHETAYHTDTCAKCGVTAKQIADGASPWCDYLDRAPHGRWAMLAHTIAILLLVIAPIYGITGSIGITFLLLAVALLVAQVHAGEWDYLADLYAPQLDPSGVYPCPNITPTPEIYRHGSPTYRGPVIESYDDLGFAPINEPRDPVR
jgi:hypothetical protein